MKKFLLLAATIMTVTLLSAPVALAVPAAPSPTEPDHPLVEGESPNMPVEPAEPDSPSIDIEDPNIPLTFVRAPQTGVTGLEETEILALAAAASAVCGAAMLVKTKKKADSAR